jgi:hypothetical protein
MKPDDSLIPIIIQHLIDLPSESFKSIQLTPDQEWYWEWMRLKSGLMGEYWWSLIHFENDPLPQKVQDEVIKESERISISNYVNFLQRLWELVHAAEHHVREAYESQGVVYPFDEHGKYSSACLCVEIIQDLINGQFERSLNAYEAFSLKDMAKLAHHAYSPEDKPQKAREVSAIASRYNPRGEKSWLLRFLAICKKASSRDAVVTMRLEALLSSLQVIGKDVEKTATRTRRTKNSIKPCSHVWRNGELLTGNVNGGTYS